MTSHAVDLYWLPLGAGGHSVRLNGRVYEALTAVWQRRERFDLYHSALEITVPGAVYTIEMAPVPDERGEARGVVAEGPVGSRWLGRIRLFRYEVRRWQGGSIPDLAEAVASPQRVSSERSVALRVLALTPTAPTFVWGRDELHAHDMWNSNSLVSWLLSRAGADLADVALPEHGRAPGWGAGVVAARQ